MSEDYFFIRSSLADFLASNKLTGDSKYYDQWKIALSRVQEKIDGYKSVEFSELSAMRNILKSIPSDSDLHLSNSMPVRFAELLGVNTSVLTHSNRGTSGIDGCTSTALGSSLVSENIHTLITGDLAFFYDRNAFFHEHDYKNLRIIVSNNQGGGIFRLIEGPRKQPELEEYFETRHSLTAESLASEFGIKYFPVSNAKELKNVLDGFYEASKRPKLIEVFTDPSTNQEDYLCFKKKLKDG